MLVADNGAWHRFRTVAAGFCQSLNQQVFRCGIAGSTALNHRAAAGSSQQPCTCRINAIVYSQHCLCQRRRLALGGLMGQFYKKGS